MIKKISYLIVGCLLYLGLQQLIELKTHGFCLQRIQACNLPHQERWETPPLSPEEQSQVEKILEQPFRMIVDRPFLCAIEDHRSGALLFLGAIYDPEP